MNFYTDWLSFPWLKFWSLSSKNTAVAHRISLRMWQFPLVLSYFKKKRNLLKLATEYCFWLAAEGLWAHWAQSSYLQVLLLTLMEIKWELNSVSVPWKAVTALSLWVHLCFSSVLPQAPVAGSASGLSPVPCPRAGCCSTPCWEWGHSPARHRGGQSHSCLDPPPRAGHLWP